MKVISVTEARSIALKIMSDAEERRRKFYEEEAEVVTLEEDMEEELLRMCRCHVQFLCDDLYLTEQYVNAWSHKAWAEAGEQIYAEWRGWV